MLYRRSLGFRVRLFEVGFVEKGLADFVLRRLPAPFDAGEVTRAPIDMKRCFDRHRRQYDACALLEQISFAEDGWTHLALTSGDLFVSVMTYVFGVSELGAFRGLLSYARLSQDADERSLKQRILIEAVHELGHTIGLVHCSLASCAMHRTLWPEGIELKQPAYCPSCSDEAIAAVGSIDMRCESSSTG
jgi:predicted Zn-dependent protease